MEADKLFMAEMEGEVAGTSLMAFKQSLAPTEKQPAVVKKENETDKIPLNSIAYNSVKVHKDFKISGQIDSKSGISYTSLIRQIEAGLKKGHSQDDIIDGVIRAVIPSSSLRSYLDGRQDMSLSPFVASSEHTMPKRILRNFIQNLQAQCNPLKKPVVNS
jgi:hypothetical protein